MSTFRTSMFVSLDTIHVYSSKIR